MQNTTKIAIILITIIDYNAQKDKEDERYEEKQNIISMLQSSLSSLL
jgi:hypothetical protein